MSTRRLTVNNGQQQADKRLGHRRCTSTSPPSRLSEDRIPTNNEPTKDMSFDLGIVPEEPHNPIAQAENALRQTITSLFNETVASQDEFLKRDSLTGSEHADELHKHLDELRDVRKVLQLYYEHWERIAESCAQRRKSGQEETKEDVEEGERVLNELYRAFERHQKTLRRAWKADVEIRGVGLEHVRKALEELRVDFARLKLEELELGLRDVEKRRRELEVRGGELDEWMKLG
ncbi:hypothetical protein W97_03165 [Coniosporium apollinis CBS 100218]|uniref:Uncharacterized protein n=1 Tax=Coniosporium apollinis (strain CBS 100218) TaxID=1168221 RepID=R7YPW3_CONA1|nr:uncharacterized protein W97_03165 [Coniosporium apollinis CBS 100218]EON63937.1 hypothetical protein W97_03165 [Coniosporium apollinis CBS 100218]